jgi:hypothetical protein
MAAAFMGGDVRRCVLGFRAVPLWNLGCDSSCRSRLPGALQNLDPVRDGAVTGLVTVRHCPEQRVLQVVVPSVRMASASFRGAVSGRGHVELRNDEGSERRFIFIRPATS